MSETGKTKKHDRKGSLTTQVIGLYWCVLILIFGINGLLMYRFSMRQEILYHRQTAAYSAADFVRLMEELMPSQWLLDYWNAHPEAPELARTTDIEAYRDVFDGLDEKLGEGWEFTLSSDDIGTWSPEEQQALSKYCYDDLQRYSDVAQEESRGVLEGPIIACGRAGEAPRVCFSGSRHYDFRPGATLDIPEDQLKQLGAAPDQALTTIRIAPGTGGRTAPLSVVACSFDAGDGDLAAYVMMGVDEVTLKQRIMGTTLRIIGIDALISLLLGFVLMHILYRRMLCPVTSIQKGLHVYVENGDTAEVVKTMDSIQAGNEIGRLAGDIGDMVRRMEAQVRARQQLEDRQEKLAAELEHAARIQAAMLPKRFPDRAQDRRLELYAAMAPAREVGGDLYDFFMIDQDRLALVIADVSGKGIPAALFMMQAKTLFREIARPDVPIDVIAERVNRGLCAFNEQQQFITTWMMIVDLSTGRALEINAGHTKPALCRAQGRYELVRNLHDLPLGLMDDLTFTVHEWRLEPGDRLFVYTDGVHEAENSAEEQYGPARLLSALNEQRQAPQKETLASVLDSVRAFTGPAPQTDDITMLGMTYFGDQ